MGTNCAPLVADLFLFCYERDFMMSLSGDKPADIIDASDFIWPFLTPNIGVIPNPKTGCISQFSSVFSQ